jgi:UDP-glucose 4-epimerase
MKVLVTGAAGYIGSVVTTQLLEEGHEVIAFDNLSHGHKEAVHPDAMFVLGDLLDRKTLAASLEGVDAVAHLAAEALVDESMRNPGKYFRANFAGGLNLLDAMVTRGIRRLVFSSTAAVYGDREEMPIHEDAPCDPVNAYGESKLGFEKALNWYNRAHDIRFATFRYFNVCGATDRNGELHEPETHLIPIVLQVAAGTRESMSIFGTDYDTPDGSCIRDYIHVSDIARAHVLALHQVDDLGGCTLNIGNDTGYSNLQVVETARRVTGRAIAAEPAPRRPGDPARLVASNNRTRQVLGWEPQHPDLEGMITSAWKWMREHP